MIPQKIKLTKTIKKEIDKKEKPILENLPFSFDLIRIYTPEVEEDCTCQDKLRGIMVSNQKLCDYEKLVLVQYFYNDTLYRLKAALSLKDKYDYFFTIVKLLKSMKSAYFWNIIPNSSEKIFNIEKTLGTYTEISNLLENMRADKRNNLTLDELFSCQIFCDTLEKEKDNLVKKISTWLEKIKHKKLKKAEYTKNLETLLEAFGINDDLIKQLAKFFLYSELPYVKTQLNDIYSKSYEDLQKLLGTKRKINTNLFLKHNELFMFNSNEEEIRINLNYYLKYICLLSYRTPEELFEKLTPKLRKVDLTQKDFEYITQYKYIKSILENNLKKNNKGVNILLYGEPGTGKTALAKVLIQDIKANGFEIENTKEITNFNEISIRNGEKEINAKRKSQLLAALNLLKNSKNAVLLYDEAEDFFRCEHSAFQSKNEINNILENNKTPIIWTTNSLTCMESSFLRRFTYTLNVDQLPRNTFKNIIKKLENNIKINLPEQFEDLLLEYMPSVGITKKLLNNYKISQSKDFKDFEEDLLNSLKSQNHGESVKKIKIKRPVKFDANLLNTSDDLIEFTQNIKALNRRDFSLLLYGVSGAGKTFYADYLGEQLNMPVIKKKASDLESMWVGETEKNIAKMFDEGRLNKAIIVIDEGDHFISDRAKHLRTWETSRTEEMLQQIETYEYPVIFTTNLMQNIDKAAMRRFTYKTEFKYLTSKQVELAWNIYFPKAELPKDLHLSKLCPGDFATVLKRAEFGNYTDNTTRLYNELYEEMCIKKEEQQSNISF